MKSLLMAVIDELLEEDMGIVNEVVEDEIKPIIKYRQNLENTIFNKAYKEVLDMEREV